MGFGCTTTLLSLEQFERLEGENHLQLPKEN
jgi:hypothetical protein